MCSSNDETHIVDEFAQFEHAGWERVADKYDSVWSSLTRQFIPHLLDVAGVSSEMSVLDVACGPGYLSAAARKLGAVTTGIDFSKKMVAIAKEMFPGLEFTEGDAQDLPCESARFDRVLINFGLLHLSHPEKACAEAFRVLKSGGKFGFTVWAQPEENPGGKIVNDAVNAHADLSVELPVGPPYYLYTENNQCRRVLQQVGFDGGSMGFQTRLVEWLVPTADYLFEAERDAGVRTAGLLARQSPEKLNAILSSVANAVRRYAQGDQFAIPMAAHSIVVSKK